MFTVCKRVIDNRIIILILFILAAFLALTNLFGIFKTSVGFIGLCVGGFYFYHCVKDPFYCLPLLFFSVSMDMFGRIAEGTSMSFTIFHVSYALFLGSFFIHKIIRNDFQLRIPPLSLMFCLLFVWICFSILYSPARIPALILFIRIIFLFIYYICIYNLDLTMKKIKLFIGFIGFNIIAISLHNLYTIMGFSMAQIMMDRLNPMGKITRLGGLFENVNNFAILIITFIIIILSVVFLSKIKFKNKIILLMTTLPVFGALVFTFTRSVPLILMCSLFVIYLQSPYKRIFHVFMILFLSTIGALYFFSGFIQTYVNRIIGLLTGEIDFSAMTRLNLLLTGIEGGFENFWFGLGFKGFPEYFQSHMPHSHILWEVFESHNILVTYFSELGIIGVSLILMIFISYFIYHYSRIKKMKQSVLKAVYTGFFLCSFQYILFFQFEPKHLNMSVFWLFCGIVFSIQYHIDNKLILSEDE